MTKKYIYLDGLIAKNNGEEFTDEELDQLMDLILEYIESKDWQMTCSHGFKEE